MKHAVTKMIAAGTMASGLAMMPAPAMAQLGIGVDTGVDVGVGVGVERERPMRRDNHHYTYGGYASHEWHTRHPVHRTDRWNARYKGYDCYESFRYDYQNGDRVKYTSTFCYDERGRSNEVRSTRVVARIG